LAYLAIDWLGAFAASLVDADRSQRALIIDP